MYTLLSGFWKYLFQKEEYFVLNNWLSTTEYGRVEFRWVESGQIELNIVVLNLGGLRFGVIRLQWSPDLATPRFNLNFLCVNTILCA